MGRDILLVTAYIEHSVGFSQRYHFHVDARRVFSHERWETPIYLGSGLQFSPPSLWQDLPIHGGSFWIPKLGAPVVLEASAWIEWQHHFPPRSTPTAEPSRATCWAPRAGTGRGARRPRARFPLLSPFQTKGVCDEGFVDDRQVFVRPCGPGRRPCI